MQLAHPIEDLLDATPDPMVVTDRSGIIVVVNQHTEGLFGYSRTELVGQPVEILLPRHLESLHTEHRRRYMNDPRPRSMDGDEQFCARRKNGSEFAVDISLSPIEIAGKTFVISAIRDVSRRMAEVERRFSAIFQQKHQLAAIVERDGVLSDVNDRALKYSGLKREDVIGRHFAETGWWTHDARLQNRLRDAIDTAIQGETVTFVATHPRPDGSLGMVDFSIRPVFDERQNVAFLVPESQDITDKHMAENAQEALERAIGSAKEANVAKSRFLAAASHDLRQPLQSLGIYLAVLERQLEHEQPRDLTRKMRQSLDAMGELLNALLDVSKFDRGSITPEFTSFDVQKVLQRVVIDNAPHAENKGLSLSCSATHCVVYSDPALLERIIDNLVANAIRYTDEGSVAIECEPLTETVRIAVVDSGIGIPEDSLDSIFEEYYQLDNPVRDRRKGLGLGLSIVKQIASLLDHPIQVTSEPGSGSTFAVEVPVGQLIEKPADPPVTVEAATGAPPAVLLVEDDPAILEATKMLLELSGMEVYTATDGDEGMALVKEGVRPDIVVTDYRLPDYNGIELIRRVRSITADDLPTVIVTGDTSAADIRKANLPHCSVLHKPVDSDQLIELLNSLPRSGQR